jgi:transcriptional regulator with XRE-family HTH domain
VKKPVTLLRAARLKKNWTPEFVSKQVGVSLHTYARWEAGAQHPRHSSLQALCQVFDMSAEELGFAHLARKSEPSELSEPSSASIEEHDKKRHDFEESEQSELSETLTLWGIGIRSCWQLYMLGNQAELERLLPNYLSKLSIPTLTAGPDQKAAASLTSQVYLLMALLELQRCDLLSAQANGTQALVYSQLAKDWNLYVAAQIRLAIIFSARKRIGAALAAFNEALRRINANPDAISPILQSWTFAGLGEIQATMGRESEALQFLQLAIAIFPDAPEEDACSIYTYCDRSLLFLYEGLIFLRLGLPKRAWEAFSQVDNLKPTPPERIRAEFLKLKTYTSLMLGNMIQSCVYLEAAVRSAQEINSEMAFCEAYALYEHMLVNWGQEPRVRSLAKLFQR